MFKWEIFKYTFGRFCCWHIFILSSAILIAQSLIDIVVLHFAKTLKDAGITVESSDVLSNLQSNAKYIAKYFTGFDTVVVLLAGVIAIVGYYYSIVFAIKRTLFYPYKHIKLTTASNNKKAPLNHVAFILIGVLLSDYFPAITKTAINAFLPEVLIKNSATFAFSEGCLALFLNIAGIYYVLQLYLSKNANIIWLQNTENKDS